MARQPCRSLQRSSAHAAASRLRRQPRYVPVVKAPTGQKRTLAEIATEISEFEREEREKKLLLYFSAFFGLPILNLFIYAAAPMMFPLCAFLTIITFILALTLLVDDLTRPRRIRKQCQAEWQRLVPGNDDGPPTPTDGFTLLEAVSNADPEHRTITFEIRRRRFDEAAGQWFDAGPAEADAVDLTGLAMQLEVEESDQQTVADAFVDLCFAVRQANQLAWVKSVQEREQLALRQQSLNALPSYSRVIA